MSDGKYPVRTRFGEMLKAAVPAGNGLGVGEASASPRLWHDDQFVLAAAGAQDLTLTYLPVDSSPHVELNGLGQRESVDYTMDGVTVHVLTAMDVVVGDVVDVRYEYEADTPVPLVDDLTTGWSVTGTGIGTAGISSTVVPVSLAGSGVQAGDLLLACIRSNGGGVSVPAGWTLVRSDTNSGGPAEIWQRTATSADVGHPSYAFSHTNAADPLGIAVIAYHGPTSVVASDVSLPLWSTAQTTLTAPSLTVPGGGGWLVCSYSHNTNGGTNVAYSTAPGMTPRTRLDASVGYIESDQQDQIIVTPGASGTRTVNTNNGRAFWAIAQSLMLA